MNMYDYAIYETIDVIIYKCEMYECWDIYTYVYTYTYVSTDGMINR